MTVVRARTENQSWHQFYSDLLSHHALDTILLTLARLSQLKGDISWLCSHWSSQYITVLSLVKLIHYCALIGRELQSDATPASSLMP